MQATIRLTNEINEETINIFDVKDRNMLVYQDGDGADCRIAIFEDGLVIERNSSDHRTLLDLRQPCRAVISSDLGELEFEMKRLEFSINDGNIVVAYTVNDVKTVMEICFRW